MIEVQEAPSARKPGIAAKTARRISLGIEAFGRILSVCLLVISILIYKVRQIVRRRGVSAAGPLTAQLHREGRIVVPGFLAPEICDRVATDIRALYERTKRPDEFKRSVTKLPSGTHADHRCDFDGKTWMETRTTDFKKIDGEFPYLRDILTEDRLLDIVRPFYSGDLAQRVMCRVYYSQGTPNPRGFHCDGTDFTQFKCFIYMTDVELENGPYSYIPGTHRSLFWIFVNLFYNAWFGYEHNDCRIAPAERTHKFVAKKGTLIITDNNGIHRGQPQAPDSERIVLVGMISAQRNPASQFLWDAARGTVNFFDKIAWRIDSIGDKTPQPYQRGWIENRKYWH